MGNYLKARLKLIRNRKGLALPVVLFFMLVSQLLYMGLIRLNQLNMLHHQLFQQHFQAQVQANIAWAAYNPVRLAKSESLETQFLQDLGKDIERINERLADGKEIDMLDERVYAIEDNESGLLLVSYALDWENAPKWQQEWDLNQWNQEVELTHYQQQLASRGYEYQHSEVHEYAMKWQVPMASVAEYRFVNGKVIIEPQQETYFVTSRLAESDFVYTKEYEVEEVKSVIHYTIYFYAKKIDF